MTLPRITPYEYVIMPMTEYLRLTRPLPPPEQGPQLPFVRKTTDWVDCAACTYCGAPKSLPCQNMRITERDADCMYPHPQRRRLA